MMSQVVHTKHRMQFKSVYYLLRCKLTSNAALLFIVEVSFLVAYFSGFGKGMVLTVKQGINRIQIPESMIKVGPSKSCQDEYALVVFKKLSAPSQDNKYFGRFLDPAEEPPASFLRKSHKDLSDMYQRVFIGLGLPPWKCAEYVRRSRKNDGKMHANLTGVADPTGCIPRGEVFIPGCETAF
jgi:hypothetical protein